MAGIGDYKKGGKFTLKSGNSPLFKHMGSSPLKTERHHVGITKKQYYKPTEEEINKAHYEAEAKKRGKTLSPDWTERRIASLTRRKIEKDKREGVTNLTEASEKRKKAREDAKNKKSPAKKKGDDVVEGGVLPTAEIKAKKDKITWRKPTDAELTKAKRTKGESSSGTSAEIKTNKTTGKSEMVTIVTNQEKYDARKAAEAKVREYNKKNKGKKGYKRQTFAKNISKDNVYTP
tara:strand:+ start:396 stop:1094 length:699 start_codon:yes stop_codon:yes gene_type:complete